MRSTVLRALLALSLSLFLLPWNLRAGTGSVIEQQAHAVSISSRNAFSLNASLPGFDPSSGELRSITVCWRYLNTRAGAGENLAPLPGQASLAFQGGQVSLSGGAAGFGFLVFPQAFESFDLEAFDGVQDDDGPSGFSFTRRRGGFVSATFDSPEALAWALGGAVVDLTLEGQDSLIANAPASVALEAASITRVDAQVVYHFLPAP